MDRDPERRSERLAERLQSPPIDRRRFIERSLAFAAACAFLRRGEAAMPPSTAAAEPVLVVVNLTGGNDGLNTVVPLELPIYRDKRPTLAIAPQDVVRLDRGPAATTAYGLHPSLERFGQIWQDDGLAIVQKVGYPDPWLSHFESADIWSRGARDPESGNSGWIARYKDLYAPKLLGVVGIGTGQLLDFQGGETQSLLISSIEEYQPARLDPIHQDRSVYGYEIAREVRKRGQFAGRSAQIEAAIQAGVGIVDQFRAAAARYANGSIYPQGLLAEQLRDAAILLNAGLPTRVFYVMHGTYDTHSAQKEDQAVLLADLDAALGAFALDLAQLGIWQRTIVAVISEFGRRTQESWTGTDHGAGSVMLLLGGAVRSGIYGGDLTAADLAADNVPFATDFRTVFWEILERHHGADPTDVFVERPASTAPLGFVR